MTVVVVVVVVDSAAQRSVSINKWKKKGEMKRKERNKNWPMFKFRLLDLP
jgi:hypothetical protein